MRKIRVFLVLTLSVLLGLTAVGLAATWLKGRGSPGTVKVVIAARDLPMGTKLQSSMVQVISWPVDAAVQEPLGSIDLVTDRVINVPVWRGEPILKSKLAAVGEKGGLSAVLTAGQRAVTVKVNEIVGVAGFALPGNFVDVMVHIPDGDNNPVSKIVLERIQVLAVAQDVSINENKPRVVNAVTLEVTPRQAEQIDLARSVGTLSLVLRSQVDTLTVETTGARKLDLIKPAPVAVAASVRPASRVSIRKVTAREDDTALRTPGFKQMQIVRGTALSLE